jgi:hypothetical protein
VIHTGLAKSQEEIHTTPYGTSVHWWIPPLPGWVAQPNANEPGWSDSGDKVRITDWHHMDPLTFVVKCRQGASSARTGPLDAMRRRSRHGNLFPGRQDTLHVSFGLASYTAKQVSSSVNRPPYPYGIVSLEAPLIFHSKL